MQLTREAPVCPFCGKPLSFYLCETEEAKLAGWTCRCEEFARMANKLGAKPF